MSRLNREALARRARDLAITQGSTVREAYRELGRRAGKASGAKRREKQLSTQPTLPVFLTKEAPISNPHLGNRPVEHGTALRTAQKREKIPAGKISS